LLCYKKVWNLSLFLDGAETKARESGVFMNWPSFPAKSISLVMIKLVLNINPTVYPFDFMEKRNLRITTHLNEPGTTSYNITTTLTNDDSEILVERYANLDELITRLSYHHKKEPVYHFLKHELHSQYMT
jgi:quinol monooxygenase YgiN